MAITKATASSIAPAAKGDLVVGSATNDASILAVGTNTHILTADSSTATGLKWAAPAGGGKVLQVVSATITSATTIAVDTDTDTSITATITPTLATSTILVLVNFGVLIDNGSATGVDCGGKLLRGATTIMDYGINELVGLSGGDGLVARGALMILDTPATTSSTTYKLQARLETAGSSRTSIWQYGSSPSTITLLEIGV